MRSRSRSVRATWYFVFQCSSCLCRPALLASSSSVRAALTALALFSAYSNAVTPAGADPITLDIVNPDVVIGLFLGGIMPFFIAAATMTAVGRAAEGMVQEVRRQFREITGLMEGKAQPDSARCVDISTQAALREMKIGRAHV